VGKLIQRVTAGSGKRLTLELGGKAANIVFADAALDQAIEGIVRRHLFQPGSRLLRGLAAAGEESIADELLAKLDWRIRQLRVGDPLDKNTDVGAINSKAQLEKIREMTQYGVDEGAHLHQPPCELPSKGYFFPPTYFSNVAQSHRIAREEIFGPVLAVMTFRTPDEAIDKANNLAYGLSAGVWTDKGAKIFAMTKRLRAGVVWANTFNKFDPTSPFGGYKESGFGSEGGVHGLSRLALLGAAREFLAVEHAKVIVCLRRDLIERVFRLSRSGGEQEEKYHSLYLPLTWTESQLLEVLDRRVGQLVRSRYSSSQQVSYRDLLPKAVRREPVDRFICGRANRPRDIIAFFNECIRAGVDHPRLTVERIKLAEGEYSKGRFRALGDEWEGEYPGILDAAQSLLKNRPPSFRLDVIPRIEVEDLALELAIEYSESQLGNIARQCADALIPWDRFRNYCFNLFYRVGLVGLKTERTQGASWADELGRGITAAEIDGATSALVSKMYWRVLNVREH
jgi:hypothetical protein